jgi:hypothetical protein
MAYRLAARPERFTSAPPPRPFEERTGKVQHQSRSGVTVVTEAIPPPPRSIGESVAVQSDGQSVNQLRDQLTVAEQYLIKVQFRTLQPQTLGNWGKCVGGFAEGTRLTAIGRNMVWHNV